MFCRWTGRKLLRKFITTLCKNWVGSSVIRLMVKLKTAEEIAILKEGGQRHAFILSELAKKVAPGVSTNDLENYARKLLEESGDKGAFLNYKPAEQDQPTPQVLMFSA